MNCEHLIENERNKTQEKLISLKALDLFIKSKNIKENEKMFIYNWGMKGINIKHENIFRGNPN